MVTARSTARPTRARSGSSARRRPRTGRAASRRPSRKRPRRSVRRFAEKWWPALLVVAAALAGVAWESGDRMTAPAGICTMAASGVTVTAEQLGNAEIIAQVARDRGLPDRAIVIALATAMQESRLRNLDYGDRDSLGLFQQRPSQGWGTEAQVQDPVYAAGKFYDGLVRVPNWETGRLTEVADAVQRSAFPEAYEQWGGMAEELTISLNARSSPCAPGPQAASRSAAAAIRSSVAVSASRTWRAPAGP